MLEMSENESRKAWKRFSAVGHTAGTILSCSLNSLKGVIQGIIVGLLREDNGSCAFIRSRIVGDVQLVVSNRLSGYSAIFGFGGPDNEVKNHTNDRPAILGNPVSFPKS